MNDMVENVVKSMCNSEYLTEWIIALRDNEKLFSTNNINHCIVEGDYIRSNKWAGLEVLRKYVELDKNNAKVDEFIVELLNKSIAKYESDTEKDEKKKLNSSYFIVLSLIDLALSKEEYIDKVDVVKLVDIYFDSSYADLDYFIYLLKEKSVLLKADNMKVYDIIKLLLDNKQLNGNHYEDLVGSFFLEIIGNAPQLYFDYINSELSKEKLIFFDMGAFINYPTSGFVSKTKIVCLLEWLKHVSKYVDYSELEKTILTYINSENEYSKRIGLALININFSRCYDIFVERIKEFCEEKTYYSDLFCLLKSNIDEITNQKNKDKFEKVLASLKVASFGSTQENYALKLRNHIWGIFRNLDLGLSYLAEDEETIDSIAHYNKHVWIVNSNYVSEDEKIYSEIKEMDEKEAFEYYASKSDGSYMIRNSIDSAFVKYICENKLDINEYFDLLNWSTICELLNSFKEQIDDYYNLLKLIIEKRINEKTISQILYSISFLSNKWEKESLELLIMIDYEIINKSEENEKKCVQDYFYDLKLVYLELVAKCSSKGNEKFFIETLKNHYINEITEDNRYIIAYVFPYVLLFNKELANSILDEVFSNNNGSVIFNISYILLSYSSIDISDTFNLIKEKKSFADFIEGNFEDNHYKNSLMTYSTLITRDYFEHGKNKNLLELIIKSNNAYVINQSLSEIKILIISSAVSLNELHDYFEILNEQFDNIIKGGKEIDNIDLIIKELSAIAVLANNNVENIWSVLISCFKHFKGHIYEDVIDMLKKYKKNQFNSIKKIMKLYIQSYRIYYTNIHTLIRVLSIFKNDKMYEDEYKKWIVELTKKDDSIDELLK